MFGLGHQKKISGALKKFLERRDWTWLEWDSDDFDSGTTTLGASRFSRYQKCGFLLDGHCLERSGFFARWDL